MITSAVDKRRVKELRGGELGAGAVIYVMSRDQRVDDNWALLYAQELALGALKPLVVVAVPMADYPNISERQYRYSVAGLVQVEKKLARLNIPMFILMQKAKGKISEYISKFNPSILVFDLSPLRESREWNNAVINRVKIPVYEVDAHNIVPVWEASDKLEYAAYTIRPKINRLLPGFLTEFPRLKKHPIAWPGDVPSIDWDKPVKALKSDGDPVPNVNFRSGSEEAVKTLNTFFRHRLDYYDNKRNDPNAEGQSDLSPYLHFGQISAQRVALEVQRHEENITSQEAFLEELIVRRELSDNFCYYNENYDTFDGFPDWAKKTLNEHRHDPRPYIYDRNIFERGETHDKLWNTAQMEMVLTGKMHGYIRMYWAKKILEWSVSPDEALSNTIYLNNKYELDGHDPNGYAGIAWSIGGVHDRAWSERDIFGKIRYMSYDGCKRKFSIADYIDRISILKSEALK